MSDAPKPPKHSYSYRIGDFNGNDATDFFDGDFHLDNLISTNLKFKPGTPGSSFKLTFKTRPSTDSVSNSTEGTFVFPISKEWSSNGHPLSTEFKFKPKGYSFTFSYNPFQLGGTNHWLNPYFGVCFPTTFSSIQQNGCISFGNILHSNCKNINTVTNSLLEVRRDKENNFVFDATTNNAIYWKNFTLSSISKMGFRPGEPFTKSNSACIGAEWKNIWANVVFEQGKDSNNLGLGVKHQVNNIIAVAVQRWQELQEDGIGAGTTDIGVEVNHCKEFQFKFILQNFATLGFWANVAPCKNFTGSLCYERNLKGGDFNWGVKLTHNI